MNMDDEEETTVDDEESTTTPSRPETRSRSAAPARSPSAACRSTRGAAGRPQSLLRGLKKYPSHCPISNGRLLSLSCFFASHSLMRSSLATTMWRQPRGGGRGTSASTRIWPLPYRIRLRECVNARGWTRATQRSHRRTIRRGPGFVDVVESNRPPS